MRLLGLLLFQRGAAFDAERFIRQAIAVEPTLAKAHDNLAYILHAVGRQADALTALGRAVELAPDSADLQYSLGAMLRDAGRLDEAIACFQKALRLQPDHRPALLAWRPLASPRAISRSPRFRTGGSWTKCPRTRARP